MYLVKNNEDGTIKYYKDDVLHRDGDKPAVEYSDGRKYMYVDGKFINT